MKFAKLTLVVSLFFVISLVGCGNENAETTDNNGSAASGAQGEGSGTYFNTNGSAPTMGDTPYTVAGVTFTPPTSWRDEGTTSMRKAQFAFGPEEGDTDSATVVVFYFGPNQGGAADANITRWIGQMAQPDGSSSADKAHQYQTAYNGMAAHVVELTGSYQAGGMGMGTAVTKDGYLMVAVVLEGPEGSLFFKLTGPEKTATDMAGEFAHMMVNVSAADAVH